MKIGDKIDCIFCANKALFGGANSAFTTYECPSCGMYEVFDGFGKFLEIPRSDIYKWLQDNKYAIAGLLRDRKEAGVDWTQITLDNHQGLLDDPLVPDLESVTEKADKLLLYLRRRSRKFNVNVDLITNKVYSAAYAHDREEMEGLLDLLGEQKKIKNIDRFQIGGGDHTSRVVVTAKGWEYANKMGKTRKKLTQGFIAIKFDGEEDTDERIAAIEECIKGNSYDPICLKEKHYNETIMEKAFGEIKDSRFIVADITKDSGPTTHEIGYAYGKDIPVILVAKKELDEKGKLKIPGHFYLKHYNIILYETIDELKNKLLVAIKVRA